MTRRWWGITLLVAALVAAAVQILLRPQGGLEFAQTIGLTP